MSFDFRSTGVGMCRHLAEVVGTITARGIYLSACVRVRLRACSHTHTHTLTHTHTYTPLTNLTLPVSRTPVHRRLFIIKETLKYL